MSANKEGAEQLGLIRGPISDFNCFISERGGAQQEEVRWGEGEF